MNDAVLVSLFLRLLPVKKLTLRQDIVKHHFPLEKIVPISTDEAKSLTAFRKNIFCYFERKV